MECDVAIVGGGPAGCRAAAILAAAGCKTVVLEEHDEIGRPVQCAGLVSPRVLEISGYDGPRFTPLHGVTLHSPSGYSLTVKSTKIYAVPIDRAAFDKYLAEKAGAARARFMLGTRVEGFSYCQDGRGGVELSVRRKGSDSPYRLRAQILIGADGVNSIVAKSLGLLSEGRVRLAAVEVALGPNSIATPGHAEVFLGRDIAPGWFGWIFPLGGGLARVGTGSVDRRIPPGRCLAEFISRHPECFADCERLGYAGGVVPIGSPAKIYADRVMLVGDAAGQVKPVSGGGLYFGLQAAAFAAETALEAFSSGDFSAAALARYQLRCSALTREIQVGLALRKFYLSLDEDHMDGLVRFFSRRFWTGLVARYGDIDYPSTLAGKIARVGLTRSTLLRVANMIPGMELKGAELLGGMRAFPSAAAAESPATDVPEADGGFAEDERRGD